MRKYLALQIILLGIISLKRISVPVTKVQTSPPILPNLNSDDGSLRSVKSLPMKLQNFKDLQYYGPLKLGSSKVEMNFIFDTGSHQLWFATTECSNCDFGSKHYDTNSSTYYQMKQNKISSITYLKGQVRGYHCQDQVWFTENAKIDQMPCIAANNVTSFKSQNADGILGIGPSSNSNFPFILDLLKNQGLIDKRILSFALKKERSQTQIIFGEPEKSLSQYVTRSIPLQLKNLNYYVELNGCKIGGYSLSVNVNEAAVLDSGTSLMAVPSEVYLGLIKFYTDKGANLKRCQHFYCAYCSQIDKSSLILTLGGQDFSIPFDELWVKDQGNCLLVVQTFQNVKWVLGDIFLRNYEVMIDYDNSQVTFIGSNKEHAGTLKGWMVYLALVLVLVIYVAIHRCCSRKGNANRGFEGRGVGIRVRSDQI